MTVASFDASLCYWGREVKGQGQVYVDDTGFIFGLGYGLR